MALNVVMTCCSSLGPVSVMGGARGLSPNWRTADASCSMGLENWRAANAVTMVIDTARKHNQIAQRVAQGIPQVLFVTLKTSQLPSCICTASIYRTRGLL